MKVFAIIAASLMAAGGSAYSLCSTHECGSTASPLAQVDASLVQPSGCATPCPDCATNCADCCAVCDECCAADGGAAVSTPAPAKHNCCSVSPALVASMKADCCLPGAPCCVSACCADPAVAAK